eukprot:6204430-Pleurochrysis_carterae.AAC.2
MCSPAHRIRSVSLDDAPSVSLCADLSLCVGPAARECFSQSFTSAGGTARSQVDLDRASQEWRCKRAVFQNGLSRLHP